MTESDFALLMSGASLALSISGFLWSIWKEFIFVKPKINVSFTAVEIFGRPTNVKNLLALSVTNMGPGPVTLYACVGRGYGKPFFKRRSLGIINPIHGDPTIAPHESIGPFSAGLPVLELEPGKSKQFYFPYSRDCFLQEPLERIGVHDTYGRYHWCSRGMMLKAREKYWKDFPPRRGTSTNDAKHTSQTIA